MPAINILVLEDNPRITKLYEKIFLSAGFGADFVSDKISCVDKFSNNCKGYDYVIFEKSTKFDECVNLEDKILSINPQQKIFFLSPYLPARDSEFDSFSETMSLIDKPFAMVSLLSYLEIHAPAISQ